MAANREVFCWKEAEKAFAKDKATYPVTVAVPVHK
jgi:hypothetical protein